jgi:hypothetical protein
VVWEYPVFIGVILAIAIWVHIENKRLKKKFDILAKERHELSICDFARSFDCREIDTWVIRAVYEQIQEEVFYKESPLPIKADDNLFEVLEIDEEDLAEVMIDKIAQRTRRSLNNMENNPFYGNISTVRDLVGFINAQPLCKNT